MAINKAQVKLQNKLFLVVLKFLMNCHFDQRDDCTDTGGRAMHGAIAEKSCYSVVT